MVEEGNAPDLCGQRLHTNTDVSPSRHTEIAQCLIYSGARVDLSNIAGCSVLGHATIREGPQLDVARVSLEGADPNYRNKVHIQERMAL